MGNYDSLLKMLLQIQNLLPRNILMFIDHQLKTFDRREEEGMG